MITLIEYIEQEIIKAIKFLTQKDLIKTCDFEQHVSISVIEKDSIEGDFSTNIAMILAHKENTNAIDIAKMISNILKDSDFFSKIYYISPGFINFTINDSFFLKEILQICKQKNHYGASNAKHKENINIEFASANPTGPIHIGHIRGAVLGDSLSNILKKVGAKVTSEYYINDAGSQIKHLTTSVMHRINELYGLNIDVEGSLQYPGKYVEELAQDIILNLGRNFFDKKKLDEKKMQILEEEITNRIMQSIKIDLSAIKVQHDCFISEKSLINSSRINDAIKILKSKNLIYKGILKNPKGLKVEDWEPREQILFKSSEFDDDIDRPLQKADGSWTYFASDIAYHFDKIKRGFNHLIVILGKDHGSYSKRLSAAIAALSDEKVKFTPIMYDIVNIKSGNSIIKMSKRKGNFLTIKELLAKLDQSLIRILMLTRAHNSILDFDTESAVEQSKDNPAFYIQYAHARACSLINQSLLKIEDIINREELILSLRIKSRQERKLIITLCMWPVYLLESAQKLEPHRINFYLIGLSKLFHSLWNSGKTDSTMRFILKGELNETSLRISLAFAVKNIISEGLSLIGVEAKNSM